jgi:hypothetical protein
MGCHQVGTVCYVHQDLIVLLCRLTFIVLMMNDDTRMAADRWPAGEEWESGIHLHVRKLTLSDPSDNIKYHTPITQLSCMIDCAAYHLWPHCLV